MISSRLNNFYNFKCEWKIDFFVVHFYTWENKVICSVQMLDDELVQTLHDNESNEPEVPQYLIPLITEQNDA